MPSDAGTDPMVIGKSAFDTMADRYDAWYDSEEGSAAYGNELECVKAMVPKRGPILEVGVGTGRFAMHFPGSFGVDPALGALKFAIKRGVRSVAARGEDLPFREKTFGCILIVATLCFVDDPLKTLKEAERVLKDRGSVVIGFIPGDSPCGALYEKKKKEGHPFYKNASFFTYEDLKDLIREAGLQFARCRSTLLQGPGEYQQAARVMEGYLEGSGFVCVQARKRREKS